MQSIAKLKTLIGNHEANVKEAESFILEARRLDLFAEVRDDVAALDKYAEGWEPTMGASYMTTLTHFVNSCYERITKIDNRLVMAQNTGLITDEERRAHMVPTEFTDLILSLHREINDTKSEYF